MQLKGKITKILVMEPEPDFDLLIKQYFREKIFSGEYKFIFCQTVQQAIALLEEDHKIHIVITDINIANESGLLLLEKISSLERFCKAIVISAFGDMRTVRLAMNRGAFDFIMKPIDFKDLELTIQRLQAQLRVSQETKMMKSELRDLEKQLDIARNIQQSFLPHQFNPMPHLSTFELYGTMQPAKHVGGDFFDFFPLDENRLGIFIADVSGKGVPASLFMAVSRTIIRITALKSSSALDTIKDANRFLNYDNETSLFVTGFYGIFDCISGKLSFCNAGHNPPILLTSTGQLRDYPIEQGLPLGILDEAEINKRIPYREGILELRAKDTLILYTDGITEAMNADHQIFGLQRFECTLQGAAQKTLPDLVAHVLEKVNAFVKQAPQSDDITMLCLRYLG